MGDECADFTTENKPAVRNNEKKFNEKWFIKSNIKSLV